MPSVIPVRLDQARLNVVVKVRSNIFNWRGQLTPQFVEYLLDMFASSSDIEESAGVRSGSVRTDSRQKGNTACAHRAASRRKEREG